MSELDDADLIRTRLQGLLDEALALDPEAAFPLAVEPQKARQIALVARVHRVDLVELVAGVRPRWAWLLAPHLFLQLAAPNDWQRRTRLLLCDCLEQLHGAPHPAASMVRSLMWAEQPEADLTLLLESAARAARYCGLLEPGSLEAVLFAPRPAPDDCARLVASLLFPAVEAAPDADLAVHLDALVAEEGQLRAWLWARLLSHARTEPVALARAEARTRAA